MFSAYLAYYMPKHLRKVDIIYVFENWPVAENHYGDYTLITLIISTFIEFSTPKWPYGNLTHIQIESKEDVGLGATILKLIFLHSKLGTQKDFFLNVVR